MLHVVASVLVDALYPAVPPLQLLPGQISDHLRTLHLASKAPITDPCPDLRASSTATSGSSTFRVGSWFPWVRHGQCSCHPSVA
jgi:hypothetical protein